MSYKIVVDSCCELPEKYKKDPHFEIVPLGLEVGDYRIMDDEHFNQKEFLEQVASCPQCPRSSCPSPESYRQAFESEAEHIYVVTLSGNLSGSYNSAMVGRKMYLEEDESKQIYVMDSCSASCGETQLALLAASLEEQGLSFEEVVSRLEAFRSEMNTYFVLESLDTLKKNGRLTGLQAFFATKLNIKPVMGADNGTIIKLDQARGINKAIQRMCDIAIKEAGDTTGKRAVVCHVNNPERGEYVKQELAKRASFKEIVVTNAAGVATVYANDGGIVLAIG